MRLTLIALTTLLAGFAVGLISPGFLPIPQTWAQHSAQYTLRVAEQVSLASEIRSGRQEDLLSRIEARLPEYVQTIHDDPKMKSSDLGAASLSAIKSYYVRNQIPVPGEIRGVLEGVPE